MKDFNREIKPSSYYVGELTEGIAPQELCGYLFKEGLSEIRLEDVILDVYSSKNGIYDAMPREYDIKYISLDSRQNLNFKDDERVVILNTDNINEIEIMDNSVDIIFATANRICYGINHASIFEFERVIKSGGKIVVDMSKYWYQKQFNQFLFCSRNWHYDKCVELNYTFNGHATSKYYCFYSYKKR